MERPKKAKKASGKKAGGKRASGKKAGGKRDGSKTAAVAALLKRASGCTRAQILEATGWPSVSVQQMAGNLGLKLKVKKEKGEVSRYYGS